MMGGMAHAHPTYPQQLSTEDWMKSRKALLRRYVVTEEGRALVLKSLLSPLRDSVTYATREMAEGHERCRVVNLVVQAEAILALCTGGEDYDRVAFGAIMGDAKALIEGVVGDPREVELAKWLASGTLV